MSEGDNNALQEGPQGQESAQEVGNASSASESAPASQSLGEALRMAYQAQTQSKNTARDEIDSEPQVRTKSNLEATDPDDQVTRAPESWSKEDRAAFDALDDVGRKTLLGIHKNMESGLHRKMEELAQQRTRYKGFDEFFDTFHGLYPQAERSQFEAVVVQSLPNVMNTYLRLQQNPVETLEYLAQQLNVADKLSDALIGRDESERKLRAQNVALEDERKMLRMQQQRDKIQQVERQITEFKEAKSEDGTLKHPYFDELEPVMSQLVQSNRSLTLDEAYQKAYRQEKMDEILEKERQRVTAELEEERRRKAKSLRGQSRSVGRSGASVTVNDDKALSLRDELKANLMAQIESTGA